MTNIATTTLPEKSSAAEKHLSDDPSIFRMRLACKAIQKSSEMFAELTARRRAKLAGVLTASAQLTLDL
jgi:hypothetical protein